MKVECFDDSGRMLEDKGNIPYRSQEHPMLQGLLRVAKMDPMRHRAYDAQLNSCWVVSILMLVGEAGGNEPR